MIILDAPAQTLGEQKARFIVEYFHDVNPSAAAMRIGAQEEEAQATADRLMSDPLVKEVIATMWGMILKRVATHGHCIHALPKQGTIQEIV